MVSPIAPTCAALLLAVFSAPAQTPTLDLLDGETLYEGGWLMTIGFDLLRADSVGPGQRRNARATYAAHYGLRHDLQVGLAAGWVDRSRTEPGTPEQSASGFGDVDLFAKWRFYRWDARHKALNVALIGGLTLPTGSDDEPVQPQLQPGRGSFDPAIGFGATYEPYRWRFNAAGLYLASLDTDHDGNAPGDRLFGELAIGNRFWLEPYPGPFMRLDALLTYSKTARSELAGAPLANTGGEWLAAGLNLAFRPQPALDFQTGFEVPLWQRVNGTQPEWAWGAFFTFGYRF